MGDKDEETDKMIKRTTRDSDHASMWFVYMWSWTVEKTNVMGSRLSMGKYGMRRQSMVQKLL